MTSQGIEQVVADYIRQKFMPDRKPDELTDSTPLISGGIVDSLGVLNLVTFLEERFNIHLEAYEVSVANLDTLADIVRLVRSKL